MVKSETSRKIQKRENPNDVFITPLKLSKQAIDMIEYNKDDIWFDPFRNNGSYYNQFPEECKKEWTEILDGKDFFDFNEKVDIICSNPPYSLLDNVFKKCIKLKPRVINLLIGINNLTTRRMEWMTEAGYGLTHFHMCKVWKWYGMSIIVQFELDKPSVMTFDRTIWREN